MNNLKPAKEYYKNCETGTMPSFSVKYLCLTDPKLLVRTSAGISAVSRYSILIKLFATASLMKWYLISMCFDLR